MRVNATALPTPVTVTTNEHGAKLPLPSRAVHVTVVAPSGRLTPEMCEHDTTGAAPELSDAAGAGQDTGVVARPSAPGCVCAAGHVMIGGAVSTNTVRGGEVEVNLSVCVCA